MSLQKPVEKNWPYHEQHEDEERTESHRVQIDPLANQQNYFGKHVPFTSTITRFPALYRAERNAQQGAGWGEGRGLGSLFRRNPGKEKKQSLETESEPLHHFRGIFLLLNEGATFFLDPSHFLFELFLGR